MPPPGRTGVLIAARALCANTPRSSRLARTLSDGKRRVPAFRLVGIYMPNLLANVLIGRR